MADKEKNTYVPDSNIIDSAQKIIRAFNMYLKIHDFEKDHFYFNQHLILEVGLRYWRDVYRIKDYHPIENIDCHKIAAYYTYWICRLKPFMPIIENIPPDKIKRAIRCNEEVSLIVGLGRINDERKRRKPEKKTPLDIPKEILTDYFYTLRFRPLTPDLIAFIFYFVDC